ncbi:MAG: LysR family transcriptional regulator [Alphaproteobacteria bacterium]|nr:LysR family transcriptional regulator [Alphaproteobacteria bacterium]
MLQHRQLEAFRAFIIAGGVTSAATMMNITQPAVSRLIHELEAALGLRLFVRRGTRLEPTAEAVALFDEVERSFVGLDRIERVALDLRERRKLVLRIASQPMLSASFLPRFLAQFLRERPNLQVSFVSLPSPLVVEGTASGRFDVGVAAMPVDHSGLNVEQTEATAMVAVLPASHPLAARPVLEPADFEGQPFISIGAHALPRLRLDAIFAEHGVTRDIRAESPYHHVVCSLVAEGLGLAIVERLVAEDVRDPRLIWRPFLPRVESNFAVLHPAERPLSGVAMTFIQELLGDLRAHVGLWNTAAGAGEVRAQARPHGRGRRGSRHAGDP